MFSVRRLQKAAEPALRISRLSAARASASAARRGYATSSGSGSGSRLSPVFTALLAVGVGCTGYGVWELYQSMTMWPPEVRQDLRDALKAKHANDLGLSAQYFLRAWTTVKALPLDMLHDEPYMKLSGVAVALGDVLEQHALPAQALDVYQETLRMMQDASANLSGNERLRAVAVACKIGDVAEELGKADEEETVLTYAVQEVLKLVKEANAGEIDPQAESDNETQLVLAELDLPPWISSTDVGAPLEQLAGFYKRAGKIDFAMPLYLQAISILIPPPPQESPPEDQCRGAQLMGNLSELILRRPGKMSAEKLHQAESWAKQALVIIQKTRKAQGHGEIVPICEFAYAAALFNVGMMREMAGDKDMATRFYNKGMSHSRAIGMQEGVQVAEESLKRVSGVPATAS